MGVSLSHRAGAGWRKVTLLRCGMGLARRNRMRLASSVPTFSRSRSAASWMVRRSIRMWAAAEYEASPGWVSQWRASRMSVLGRLAAILGSIHLSLREVSAWILMQLFPKPAPGLNYLNAREVSAVAHKLS